MSDILQVKCLQSEEVDSVNEITEYQSTDLNLIAFKINRTVLSNKISIPELQQAGIYFMYRVIDPVTVKVYVGKAGKRRSDTALLDRIREPHFGKRAESCDDWDKVVAITRVDPKRRGMGQSEIAALEEIMYKILEQHVENRELLMNGNVPFSGEDLDKYANTVEIIKLYLQKIMPQLFATKQISESKIPVQKFVEKLQSGTIIPEVVTPPEIVEKMVADIPEKYMNRNMKFIDLACKGGEYLKFVADRLFKSEKMIAAFPNEMQRYHFIYAHQIYGIALSRRSLERQNSLLYGAEDIEGNIKILTDINIQVDKTTDFRHLSQSSFAERIRKAFGDMKFNVVLGNPPYQQNDGGPGGSASQLYDLFAITGTKELQPDFATMIVPARWYVNGKGKNLKTMREYFQNSGKVRKIVDYPNSADVFEGVNIRGGVCYFQYEKAYNGLCNFVMMNGNDIAGSYDADLSKYTSIVRDGTGDQIIRKIQNQAEQFMSEYVMTMDYFGVRSAEKFGCATNKPQAGYAKIYTFNGVEYIQREYLNDPYRVLDRWNVLLTHSIGGDKKVVANTMRVIGPNEACSVTYLCIGGCSDQLIAERLKKYIQTKFVRFLMSLAISGQSISRESFKFVPSIGFSGKSTLNWNTSLQDLDKQLCVKFGLTADEEKYISSQIKYLDEK